MHILIDVLMALQWERYKKIAAKGGHIDFVFFTLPLSCRLVGMTFYPKLKRISDLDF